MIDGYNSHYKHGVLGIDVGGTGVKGAIVDPRNGVAITERYRIATPQPATPASIALTVEAMTKHFAWRGLIGCTLPAVIKEGTAYSAANIDKQWIELNGQSLFEKVTGCPVFVQNDADAAGIAEMRFGAGRGVPGTVMVLTFGTGIGSAIFVQGELVPNTELGHLEFRGLEAERWAAARVRDAEDLSWEQWAERVNAYLMHLEMLFSPTLFIIGGGVSRRHTEFLHHLTLKARVVPAYFRNMAGIIGVSIAAREQWCAKQGTGG